MGYGNAVGEIVALSPFGWAVAHVCSEIVLGFVARSSCIRVSRHQNLDNRTNIIKSALSLTGRTNYLPKRGLTIPYVLTFPLDHIQDMQDAVLGPILVKDTIQDCILRKYGRKGGQQVFPHQSGPQDRVWHYTITIGERSAYLVVSRIISSRRQR